jgi:hypothetical protein
MNSIIVKSSLRQSIGFLVFAAVIILLSITSLARDWESENTSQDATPPLVVTANFADVEVDSTFAIGFKLSRPLHAGEGRLAILIGQTDFTNLFTPGEDSFNYLPGILPLPEGESAVKIFLVSPSYEWRELAQLTLRVKTAHPANSSQDRSNGQSGQSVAGAAQTSNGKKYGFTPSITLGMKSQMTERHFPEANRPDRPTFADLTLQGSLRSEIINGWFNNQMQFDIVGSSYRQEALRFSERGTSAPRIDLSNYLMQFQLSKARLQIGHISIGNNRHLINSYGSRGISLTAPIGSRSDFSLAAINGTSIVGWNNFLGLNRREHQIVSATLGVEFLKERPGGLRLETSVLHGSLLPIAGFNQGVINDAEESDGGGLRLAATDKSQRLRFEGGFTRSRFNNPNDPSLNQDLSVVAVRETSRNAFYVDAGFAFLQNIKLNETKTANLALNFRLERVDPLFRSVAASTQADRFQHEIEMTGSIGQFTATVAHQRFNDNLADIPSILKTLSRRYAVIVGLPLSSLRSISPDQSGQSSQSSWLPRLGYSMHRIHQFGNAFPINSGFDSTSQIPDQISTNHDFSSEWQMEKWRLAYRFNYSFQNNRQPGREIADLRNLINGFTFGLNPHSSFDLNLDLNIESANNFETSRIDRTFRAGINTNWRMTRNITVNAIVSNTLARDVARTTRNRNTEFDLQASYRFAVGEDRWRKVQGQFFIRYADRYGHALDFIFGIDNLTRLKTLNGGLNFVFF